MKNNTLLYIGAGLAAVYLITRQQQKERTQEYFPTPTRATTGWDVAGQALNILGGLLPGLIGGKDKQGPGVGQIQTIMDRTPEFTDNGFMNWN